MKLLHAVALVVVLTGPALAQSKPVPRYGEVDQIKSPGELESERAAESAYKKSLGNVPNASGPSDPWGNIRSDGAAKTTAKAAPAKPAKSRTTTAN